MSRFQRWPRIKALYEGLFQPPRKGTENTFFCRIVNINWRLLTNNFKRSEREITFQPKAASPWVRPFPPPFVFLEKVTNTVRTALTVGGGGWRGSSWVAVFLVLFCFPMDLLQSFTKLRITVHFECNVSQMSTWCWASIDFGLRRVWLENCSTVCQSPSCAFGEGRRKKAPLPF